MGDTWRSDIQPSVTSDDGVVLKDVTVVRLPGTSHHPTFQGGRDVSRISPLYTETLLTWLEIQIRRPR
jgi:hypothetical protein